MNENLRLKSELKENSNTTNTFLSNINNLVEKEKRKDLGKSSRVSKQLQNSHFVGSFELADDERKSNLLGSEEINQEYDPDYGDKRSNARGGRPSNRGNGDFGSFNFLEIRSDR